MPVEAGQTLATGKASSGCRTYIAVRNGIDVPDYLGSKATFVLGQFGGHGGRTLRKGDVLSICQPQLAGCPTPAPDHEPAPAPEADEAPAGRRLAGAASLWAGRVGYYLLYFD